MLRRGFLFFCLSLWAAVALAQSVAKPGQKDLCPVCGMIVSKYPNWTAIVTWKDGHSHFFDGAKDLFKFLHDLAKYAPGHRREDIAAIYVTDFYNLEKIDARHAVFVTGSDALGPMGHEFVPLASQADAKDFMKDHKGRHIYTFQQIGAALPGRLDDGKFD
jgi:copper chaperone NosL